MTARRNARPVPGYLVVAGIAPTTRIEARGGFLKSYRLRHKQRVGGTLDEVFGFFKDPHNLEQLTPPFLGFGIVHASDETVKEGTTISYRLRLHGVPMRWESRITEYVEGELFADEMLSGPYRHWYHTHRFREIPGGVEIEDTVDYSLPFGPLGRIAHRLFVRRQLATIFAYRESVINQRFPWES